MSCVSVQRHSAPAPGKGRWGSQAKELLLSLPSVQDAHRRETHRDPDSSEMDKKPPKAQLLGGPKNWGERSKCLIDKGLIITLSAFLILPEDNETISPL